MDVQLLNNGTMQYSPSLIPDLSALRISGVDSSQFLDAQLSNNVSTLAIAEQCVACWCNPKGQAIAVCLIERKNNDDFLLFCNNELVDNVVSRLSLFVLRAQVTITKVDQAVAWVPPTSSTSNPWKGITVAEESAKITENTQTIAYWRNVQIMAGFSWLSKVTSSRFLPQMLALERWQAIDYQKGCFPGQEIIARTHYLGRVKRGLYRLQLHQPVPSGTAVFNDEIESGTVLVTSNFRGNTIGLAVMNQPVAVASEYCTFTSDNEPILLIKMDKIDI